MNKNEIKIAASMSCVDFKDLRKEIMDLEDAGIDILHFDFCDGFFAPTLLFSPMILKSIRSLTNMRFDVHMYCKYPSRYIKETAGSGADLVAVHIEIEEDYKEVIKMVKDYGLKAGIAILPDSGIPEDIDEILPDISLVITNTVGPAYSGQKFDERGLVNMEKMKKLIKKNRVKVEIAADGAVDKNKILKMLGSGADTFILGSSGLFFGDMNYGRNVNLFKNKLNNILQ